MPSSKMSDQSHMTVAIWSLTLEIVRLLTGKTDDAQPDHVTITVAPPPSLSFARSDLQKILKVTEKIMKLLTGELESPLELCLEVKVKNEAEPVTKETVVGGDLRSDAKMEPSEMTPERSQLGEYGDGSAAEETGVSSEEPCKEEESSHLIGADPGDALMSNMKPEEEEEVVSVRIEEDETLLELSPDPEDALICNVMPWEEVEVVVVKIKEDELSPDHGNALISNVTPEEEEVEVVVVKIKEDELSPDCGDDLLSNVIPEKEEEVVVVKIKEYETLLEISPDPGDALISNASSEDEVQVVFVKMKEEETLPEISPAGRCTQNHGLVHADIISDDKKEDNITAESTDQTISNPYPVLPPAHLSPNPSTQLDQTLPNTHRTAKTHNNALSCSICQKYFTFKNDLIRHERLHAAEKPYKCSKCGTFFSTKSDLKIHERTHEERLHYNVYKRVQHSCSACGKVFNCKSNLTTHLTKIHSRKKPHSCSECGKGFYYKYQLAVHERAHTGEKPYSCSECGKSFSTKANLTSHKKVHTGEKPYICSECGKCFSQKANFNSHERGHTRVKP